MQLKTVGRRYNMLIMIYEAINGLLSWRSKMMYKYCVMPIIIVWKIMMAVKKNGLVLNYAGLPSILKQVQRYILVMLRLLDHNLVM